ncbi:hypothetical protein Taro_003484 [Colocasia esculenta]|uniref:Thioesterase domain-containing protein n=1 Tax=Colocasia esculenta TaxID=4460 RepID=A0A843TJT4_COLES|nr:hypothetical protein [Colocasia esculenta]
MALQAARELLENAAGSLPAAILAALPSGFYDYLVTGGLRIDHVDPQRMLCSITVPHRLLSHGGVLDNGVTASLVDIIGSAAFFAAGCPTTGVSVDISISYLEAAYADWAMGGKTRTRAAPEEAVDLQVLKSFLEKAAADSVPEAALPSKFFDNFIVRGIRIDHVDPRRVLCSMALPPLLLNNGNFLDSGAVASLVDIMGSAALFAAGYPTTGVSTDINISYLDAAHVDVSITPYSVS